jgi:phosphoserine aminotransferase
MRAYNFGAGPAMLPEAVMLQVQEEFLNWHGSKMSIVEVGHRTAPFMELMAETEVLWRELFMIPAHYKVLVLTMTSRMHFAAIPMNLLGKNNKAGYVQTGTWSEMAYKEACRYAPATSIASATTLDYKAIPLVKDWAYPDDLAYIHYTDNETIHGLQFPHSPEIENIPLITDMTSSLCSQPLDIDQYGMIYAGTQKNISPAGLSVVIIREDLLEQALSITPTTWHYRFLAEQKSLYYTPNTFSCYVMNLTLKWLKSQGGLSAMDKVNRAKSELIYNTIDQSQGFYRNSIHSSFRSRVNVVFHLIEPDLEQLFLQQAAEQDLLQLKGHKLLGGLRASLYNAMPLSGAQKLARFMQDFQKRYG